MRKNFLIVIPLSLNSHFVCSFKAATSMGTCMILSSWSTSSIEDVAQASGSGLRWFQLYVCRDKAITTNLVQRAEQNGYRALVVTIDTPVEGRKLSCLRTGFDLPNHLKLGNLSTDVIQNSLEPSQSVGAELYNAMIDSSLTWECIAWIKSITRLPVIVKGVLTGEDALLAVQHGVDGIMVSNHGGRQLDGVLATVSFTVIIIQLVKYVCYVLRKCMHVDT